MSDFKFAKVPDVVEIEGNDLVASPTTIDANVRSVYIHVPFCKHRCGYCDFTLVAGRDELVPEYLRAMDLELPNVRGHALDTLYFGGGTPSHLEPDELDQLFRLVLKRFDISPTTEVTVEANPDGLTTDKIDVMQQHGVNRVSLGVQSFRDDVLKFLERDHRADDVEEVAERLRSRIPNFSVDLIFAVPGQSLSEWRIAMEHAIALKPKHISTYGLTIEKGTAFWSRLQKGKFRQAPDELERDMYAAAMDDLPEAGFEQYEISNFARPGFRSRHNSVYWTGQPYEAFGPGAARFVNGCRQTNHRSVTSWLKRVLGGHSPVAESETLSTEDRARELLVIGIRRCEGINKATFAQSTGMDVNDLVAGRLTEHIQAHMVHDSESTLKLTREGRFVADSIVVDLL